MGKPRPFLREIGQRRSARLEALEISKAAAAEEAAARAAKEAQTPREPPTEPVRRRGRKKQKCRTVEDVVVNSVKTGLQQAGDNDNQNHDLLVLGDQTNPPFPSPPDKRILESILHMLQQHDKERIFAEPVNPAEVEHYYDIIKHPMDLSTMQAKLHEGKYETLEQFERDAFLLTENAITFNDNGTIYYKVACEMRELAAKIFKSLRTPPGNCKFEDNNKWKRRSKPVGGSVKTCNEGGSARFLESAVLALPSGGQERVLSGKDGLNKNCFSGVPSIDSNPFADNTRTPENLFGCRGGQKTLVAEERENACRPYASFLSKDEAAASTVYNNRPATIVHVNGVNYKESLRNFARDLGPKAQEMAQRKIHECELREQQLQAQTEIANRIRDQQRQAEERQMRGKGPLTLQTAASVPNAPQKFPAAPQRPDIENPRHHQSIHAQTLFSDLQSRAEVMNRVKDISMRLGMSSNRLPPPSSPTTAELVPGEFTAALTDGLVTRVGEGCIVMASTIVPPSRDPGPSLVIQENNLANTQVFPTDPGPSFVAPNPAPGCSQPRQWQAEDPSSSLVLNAMHGLQVQTVIDPTEVGLTGSILAGNQAAGTWGQQPGLGAGSVGGGATQFQEAQLLGLNLVGGLDQFSNGWSEPPQNQTDLSLFQGLPQVGLSHLHQPGCDQTDQPSSSSAVRSGSTWGMHRNPAFGGDPHLLMAQQGEFPGSLPVAPISSPSPAGATWNMIRPFAGAGGGDHPQFTGHHQVQTSLQSDPSQEMPFIDLNQLYGQHFCQTEPTHNWVHDVAPSSSGTRSLQLNNTTEAGSTIGGGEEQNQQILLNLPMGSSAVGPVDHFTHIPNQQAASPSAGPVDLLTQLQNQRFGSSTAGPANLLAQLQEQHQMGSTAAGSVDLLNHQTTAGIFDLCLVESCLRSASVRNAGGSHREVSDAREMEEAALMRSGSIAFSGGASTSQQQPEPTEREFLNFLDKAQPDLALQL